MQDVCDKEIVKSDEKSNAYHMTSPPTLALI